MQQRHVRVLLSPGYFDITRFVRSPSGRVRKPSSCRRMSAVPRREDVFDLIGTIVSSLADAFNQGATTGR